LRHQTVGAQRGESGLRGSSHRDPDYRSASSSWASSPAPFASRCTGSMKKSGATEVWPGRRYPAGDRSGVRALQGITRLRRARQGTGGARGHAGWRR
jgi:hypothetical protein